MTATTRGGKVIVVGAGVAGLAAARTVREAGIDAVVIEARDRIGGRVWTSGQLSIPIDLGASWIHGERGNPIARLARRWDLRTEPTVYDAPTLFDHDGTRVAGDDVAELVEGFTHVTEAVGGLAEEADLDVSVWDAIERAVEGEELSPAERRALEWRKATIQTATAADLDRLSLVGSEADDELPGGDRIFPGGYGRIAEGLARDLEVRLGETVREIHHGSEGVVVRTDRAEHRGDAAVVTVPLGVLKAGSIRFEPELPADKRRAIAALGMGTLDKLALRFPRRRWPQEPHFFGYVAEGRQWFPIFLNWSSYTGHPVLIAFSGGSTAVELEGLSEGEVVARALAPLRAMFGEDLPEPEAVLRTRWKADPLAGGSYSHVPVGVPPEAYDVMAAPAGERVFFAGEATFRRHPSTVHGAYLSGVREGERIVRLASA